MIYSDRNQAKLEIVYNKRHKPGSSWKIEEVRMPNAYGIETTRYQVVPAEPTDESK